MRTTANLAPRRGRPPQSQAEQIEEHILVTATAFFLCEGYGRTSIEAISKEAGISKRTFYHRFNDKAALFSAVVHRLIARLRPQSVDDLFIGQSLQEILLRIGHVILHASLSEEALGLHRILMSEAARFPELARILDAEGTRQEAAERIAALLQQELAKIKAPFPVHMNFAAEQFMQMIIATPQRNALGLGAAMTPRELDAWVAQTVELFLHGIMPQS